MISPHEAGNLVEFTVLEFADDRLLRILALQSLEPDAEPACLFDVFVDNLLRCPLGDEVGLLTGRIGSRGEEAGGRGELFCHLIREHGLRSVSRRITAGRRFVDAGTRLGRLGAAPDHEEAACDDQGSDSSDHHPSTLSRGNGIGDRCACQRPADLHGEQPETTSGPGAGRYTGPVRPARRRGDCRAADVCRSPIYVLRYLCVEIHRSARRHGISDEEIQHVVDHAIVVVDLDEHDDPPKLLVIGPDGAGNQIEVIILDLADDRLMAIHAMPLRPTFHELLPGEPDD